MGGVDSVGADVFSGFAYVALGHLHGAQEPGTRDHGDGAVIRYSGSPLRYSFSESSQRKSFTIVELGARGVDTVRVVEIPQPRAMAQLSDSLAQLLEADRYAQFTDAWVQVSVTDPVRPSALYEQVRDRFPHALVVRHEPQAGALAEGSELVICVH